VGTKSGVFAAIEKINFREIPRNSVKANSPSANKNALETRFNFIADKFSNGLAMFFKKSA
jgi:hypothetical protein